MSLDEEEIKKRFLDEAERFAFSQPGIYDSIVRRGRARRAAFLGGLPVAIALVLGGSVFLLSSLNIWPNSQPRQAVGGESRDTYIHFLDAPEGVHDGSVVEAETNLVDETLLEVEYSSPTESLHQIHCCESVENGKVRITLLEVCPQDLPADYSMIVVTVSARPRQENDELGCLVVPGRGVSCPSIPQPGSVLASLGGNFEHLKGDQVKVDPDGSRYIEASRMYELSCL